jgi:flagellar hook-associated protein 2
VSTVRFTVGTTDTDIAIAAGATLQDIRTAINAANIGVTATIINAGGGTPYRLALSSNSTGTSNAINKITVLTGGDADINNLLAYNPTENVPAPAPAVPMAQTVAAANADFTINGIQIIKSSNTVTDAIDGVTLTLSKEATPATLTVARDTSAIRTAAAGFVDAYNALTSQLKSRSAYGNATTAAPVLAGDGTVRIMLDQLRGIFLTGASGGTLTTLSQVGFSTQADGTLKLDSSKLTTAMSNDFADVTNLLSSATGYATRLDTWATSVVQIGGLIDARTTSLNTSITEYNARISKLEVRMTFLQKQYTTTYSRLNSLLASMDNTSAYLTQQFSTSSN